MTKPRAHNKDNKPFLGEHRPDRAHYGVPTKPYIRGRARPLTLCPECDRYYSASAAHSCRVQS